MDIDILVEEPRWEAVGLDAITKQALSSTFAHLDLDGGVVEISVLACSDARIAVLNSKFREKPKATNVLSWPAENLAAERPGAIPDTPEMGPDGALALGDIAIAYETCEREAEQLGKPMSEHVAHLIVHGTLHLLGYDHVRDADACLMQGVETEILGKMGLNDPYRI